MIPSIAVILTDPARRILWVNEDFCHITGYAPAEAIGKVPGALLQGPKTEPEAVSRIRKGLNQKISLREQLTNYRKNGEPLPLPAGHPPGFRCQTRIDQLYRL
ncbi:MAG: hypothetical protein RL386_1062 [Bacteroidota bacterium]